jgi:Na+/H+-dicarboxylate symporter
MYIKFIGNLFLQMLKGIIIPLVIPSLIVAVGSLDIKLSGKIGGRAIGFFMSTTLIAVVVGIILVTTIKPGVGMKNNSTEEAEERYVTTEDTLMDLVRNLFPENIIQAALQKVQTFISHPGGKIHTSSSIF